MKKLLIKNLKKQFCVIVLIFLTLNASAKAHVFDVVSNDGTKIEVQETGDKSKPTIVFIHGYMGTHLNWKTQISSHLIKDFHMVTYDLRGHGNSEKPTEALAYTDGKRWADDLNAVISSLNKKEVALVGWSLGGAVISNYLAYYGDSKVTSAIYVNGVIELNAALITPHPNVYKGLISNNLETRVSNIRDFLGLCFLNKPQESIFEVLLGSATIASLDMQKNVQSMTIPVEKAFSRMSKPVYMLYGKHDNLVKVNPTLSRAKTLHKDIHVVIFDKSGHAPFFDETKLFNSTLSDILLI